MLILCTFLVPATIHIMIKYKIVYFRVNQSSTLAINLIVVKADLCRYPTFLFSCICRLHRQDQHTSPIYIYILIK